MLSSREKLEIFKGRLGIFDKNLKVVGPSGSKQPKMETSVPTVPQTNEDVEVDPKKVHFDMFIFREVHFAILQYEGNVQSSVLSSDIKRMEHVTLDSPWKSTDNNHLHCGIALMRIMETYMGLSKWASSLKKNNVSLSSYMNCP
ncbi:uncharacterized protein LOC110716928 [Chenopodium quinoa]|uniref:uncharacterized protein LOC110716928 n=1 Tax=Chenopodium quinoa TaxID=63459 RepID=UPI000B794D54|nr:uncharacterized protein LOC110716928 [Chenopodium quinoa]